MNHRPTWENKKGKHLAIKDTIQHKRNTALHSTLKRRLDAVSADYKKALLSSEKRLKLDEDNDGSEEEINDVREEGLNDNARDTSNMNKSNKSDDGEVYLSNVEDKNNLNTRDTILDKSMSQVLSSDSKLKEDADESHSKSDDSKLQSKLKEDALDDSKSDDSSSDDSDDETAQLLAELNKIKQERKEQQEKIKSANPLINIEEENSNSSNNIEKVPVKSWRKTAFKRETLSERDLKDETFQQSIIKSSNHKNFLSKHIR